jgi:zinc protease
MNQGHAPAEGEAEVEAELSRLKTQTVSNDELQKAKNQTLRDFILSRQTVQTRGEELGYAAVILKDANLVNTEPARFLAVTPADIQRVAQKYFVAQNLTLVEVYTKSAAGDKQVSGQGAGGQ